MKIIHHLFIIFVAAMLTACGGGQYTAPAHKIGQTYTGVFAAGAYNQVPLPEGEWTLAGYSKWRGNVGLVVNYALLVQTENGRLSKYVDLWSPDTKSSVGWEAGRYCQQDDLIHLVKRANIEASVRDCWGINYRGLAVPEDGAPHWKQAVKYLKDAGIDTSGWMVYVTYSKGDRHRVLEVSYGFNPQLEGFSPGSAYTWAGSKWHKDRYAKSKKRVEYIEGLKAWAEEWEPKVDAGFAGKAAE